MESFWTKWSEVYKKALNQSLPEVILHRGKDFDIIVSGIPIGSIPHIGSELLEVSSALRDSVQHLGRIPSLQVQLYLDAPREQIVMENYIYFVDHDKSQYVLY